MKAVAFLPAIGVRFDRVYGKMVCYPVSTQAVLLAELAGTKTLRPRDLSIAQRMGFTITLADGSRQLLEDFVAGRSS